MGFGGLVEPGVEAGAVSVAEMGREAVELVAEGVELFEEGLAVAEHDLGPELGLGSGHPGEVAPGAGGDVGALDPLGSAHEGGGEGVGKVGKEGDGAVVVGGVHSDRGRPGELDGLLDGLYGAFIRGLQGSENPAGVAEEPGGGKGGAAFLVARHGVAGDEHGLLRAARPCDGVGLDARDVSDHGPLAFDGADGVEAVGEGGGGDADEDDLARRDGFQGGGLVDAEALSGDALVLGGGVEAEDAAAGVSECEADGASDETQPDHAHRHGLEGTRVPLWGTFPGVTNGELAARLRDLRDYLVIAGYPEEHASRYGVIARQIEGWGESVAEMRRVGRLEEIRGVGPTVRTYIKEILDDGVSSKELEYRDTVPITVLELVRVPGLGARTARMLLKKRGIASANDLRRALETGALDSTPGVGPKKRERWSGHLGTLQASS